MTSLQGVLGRREVLWENLDTESQRRKEKREEEGREEEEEESSTGDVGIFVWPKSSFGFFYYNMEQKLKFFGRPNSNLLHCCFKDYELMHTQESNKP